MEAEKQLRIRILFGQEIAIGPGKLSLLKAILSTGSISAAARNMGMSYRRAWLLVDTMNRCFREPLVVGSPGGKGGGGATVTEFGHLVIDTYVNMEAKATSAVRHEVANFNLLLSPDSRK
jgi:molybdate transport system regulatory protein